MASMNLNSAVARIQKSFNKMNTAYQRTVFDEVAIVDLDAKELKLRYYDGPREEGFIKEFANDSVSLRKELNASHTNSPGEFSFTREGDGFGIDACNCLGPDVFLFCNNTEKSMQEITKDPEWLNAQGEFLNASQYFAVDPLRFENAD
jgi:hypothetical protein